MSSVFLHISSTLSPYTNLEPEEGQRAWPHHPREGQRAWPHHPRFPAVGLAGQTVEPSNHFATKISNFSEINQQLGLLS